MELGLQGTKAWQETGAGPCPEKGAWAGLVWSLHKVLLISNSYPEQRESQTKRSPEISEKGASESPVATSSFFPGGPAVSG